MPAPAPGGTRRRGGRRHLKHPCRKHTKVVRPESAVSFRFRPISSHVLICGCVLVVRGFRCQARQRRAPQRACAGRTPVRVVSWCGRQARPRETKRNRARGFRFGSCGQPRGLALKHGGMFPCSQNISPVRAARCSMTAVPGHPYNHDEAVLEVGTKRM